MVSDTRWMDACGTLHAFSVTAGDTVRQELADLFTAKFGHVPIGGIDTFSCQPVLMEPRQMECIERFVPLFRTALEQVVNHYFHDRRIRAIYGLDAFFESVLKRAEGLPYAIGACRPDFLQAADGTLKICEIGARFPLNGWMVSHYFNRFSAQLTDYPAGEIGPVPGLEEIPAYYARLFNAQEPLLLLMDHEKGSEIHWLLDELKQRGQTAHIGTPQTLSLEENTLRWNGLSVSQFILEMDREELRKFHPKVLTHLIENATYFNDVRTLILLHDKRILAVLYDENIMLDYLSVEDYDFLRPFLIPSYSLHDAAARKKITTGMDNWVLKQSSGGRGVGMYIRHECDEQEWQHVVEESWQGYMAQAYIPQKTFRVTEEDGTPTDIQIVGMLLCFNEAFFGVGIYRGSHHSVVNVHQGRGIIFPPAVARV